MQVTMDTKAILCVTGAILINLTLGTFYSFSNIVLYIISYMRKNGNPDLTVEYGVSLTGTYLFGQGAFIILGSYIERTWNSRVACIIGCIIHSASTYLAMWAVKMNFMLVVLIFGLGSGLGCGSSYMASIIAAQKWFPTRKGLITGLIVAGFGLGAAIASPLQTMYINPDNEKPSALLSGQPNTTSTTTPPPPTTTTKVTQTTSSVTTVTQGTTASPTTTTTKTVSSTTVIDCPDGTTTKANYFEQKDILERVPSLFLYSGIIFTVVQAIGCIIAFPPPANRKTGSSADQLPSIVEDNALPDMKAFYSAFNYRIFYIIGLMMVLVSPGYSFVVSMGKNYGQKFIEDDKFLAYIIGFAAVANALGRLSWGALMDRFSFSTCFLMKVLLFTVLIVTFPFEFILKRQVLYSVWVLGLYFCFSGTFVMFPVLVEQVFGVRYNGTIYGILYLAFASSSIVTSLIIQFTLKNSVDCQRLRIITCAVVGALYVAAICVFWLTVPVRRLENSIRRRKESEIIRTKDTLLNRADLLPKEDRKIIGGKTTNSGQSLRKENSLGSIVRFTEQPLPAQQKIKAIRA